MAYKSCFGWELTEAEIDASVEELLVLGFLIKQLLELHVLRLAGCKIIITNLLVIYHFLSSAPT